MEIETIIMALITVAAVAASFMSARAARDGVQTARDQIAASIDIAEKQIEASKQIAELQIKAELVSANRQKWIEEVRAHVTHFVSKASLVSASFAVGKHSHEKSIEMEQLKNIVCLHLDQEISSHHALWSAINGVVDYFNTISDEGPPADTDRAQAILDELSPKTIAVLEHTSVCLARESRLIKDFK